MFQSFEWSIARRYMSPWNNEGFVSLVAIFSLLGIAIGVIALIATMSVMNGFREELLSKVIGFNGHMLFQPNGGRMTDYDRVRAEIAKIPNVVQVSPMLEGQVYATFGGDYGSGALVRGMAREDLKKQPLIADNIVQGSLDDFGTGDNDLIIGAGLANKYGLGIGSTITLISHKGRFTAAGMMPRVSTYKIRAIFEVGEYNYDTGYLFMPLDQAQVYFHYPDQIAALEITLSHPDMIKKVFPVIDAKIRSMGIGGRLIDWQILNKSFFNALQVERNVMFVILTLIILVAVFNIISTMVMMVKSKTRDIAILRTMGVSKGSIIRIFFIVGSSIGLTGTFLGVYGGITLANNLSGIVKFMENLTGAAIWDGEVRFLSEIPAIILYDEVITVIIVSLSLSFLATLIPAWRAAKVDPVEALRYE